MPAEYDLSRQGRNRTTLNMNVGSTKKIKWIIEVTNDKVSIRMEKIIMYI